MRSFIKKYVFFMSVAFALFASASCEQQDATKAIHVSNVYSFNTAPQQKNGAVYFNISNASEQDDRLIGVKTDVAEDPQIHTHIMDGDIMKMRQVEVINLPHGQDVVFAPKGHHIMLMGLKNSLVEGETFPLTLVFENAGDITTDVLIKPLYEDEQNTTHHGHH